MSGYNRTTRECSFTQIHPELNRAVREYFQAHELGDPETAVRLCCETVSTKRAGGEPGSLLGLLPDGVPDGTVHLAMLMTDTWLVWARRDERSKPIVVGVWLEVVRVKPGQAYRSKYQQVHITGFANASKDFVDGKLELGAEPAAEKFCNQLVEANTKLNPPPPKRRFPKWMGG